MFLAFDPFTLLLLILACFFIPGALIALAALKGTKLNIAEKVFIGFGVGFCLPQAIPFFAYFLFGMTYTYDMALATVGIFWVIALALAAFRRVDQDIIGFFKSLPSVNKSSIVLHICLILIAVLAFWIRFGSYSPVFQELDPYYYTYISQQIITDGYNQFNDQTSWYPELNVSHRAVPELAYMESTWYSLYNGSNQYSNMLLAVIASLYPPIAAMLSFLFLYLFLSRIVRREYALIGAGIASFAPSLIFKLMAGEAEVQPYAFFAIPFFYALYLLMLQEKKRVYAVLAGIAYFALALGSSSEILGTTTLLLFWIVYGLALFLKNPKPEEIRELVELNAICLGIGVLFGSALVKGFYYGTGISLYSLLPVAFIFLLLGGLFLVQLVQPAFFRKRLQAAAVLAVALLLFIMSPLGEPIKAMGRSGFMSAQYNTPLQRTIAEQGLAGADFSGEMGFAAAGFRGIMAQFFSPLTSLITSAEAKASISQVTNTLGDVISLPFLIFWFLANLINSIAVFVLNAVLSSDVKYGMDEWKDNTLLMFWELMLIAAIIYWFNSKKDAAADELAPVLFLLVAIFPPFIVGIIKAKYTLYAAYFLGAGIAFVLSQAGDFVGKTSAFISDKSKDAAFYAILAAGVFLLVMQFVYGGYALGLAISNFQPRFQDDPLASQAKLQQICNETGDSAVCAAASNPMGYASLGTNYQYDGTLCVISALPDYGIFLNPDKAPGLYQAALLRCNRVTNYWIDSMEWIRGSTENDSRTTSWWDYGHWINFYGQKYTVLRNEHASERMIGEVAFAYTEGTEEDLIRFMKEHDSKYALFDIEIVGSSGGFGGKYGALNYLGCAYTNKTNVSFSPGESDCEAENLWEMIYVSSTTGCRISETGNATGAVAYKVFASQGNGEWQYALYYPSLCAGNLADPARVQAFCAAYGDKMPSCQPCSSRCIEQFCSAVYRLVPVYCVGTVDLADGQKMTGTYYLNETYPNGDLKLNKGIPAYPFMMYDTYHAGNLTGVTMLYTKDKVWLENGELVDGYADRKGHFYDSNIYKAFVLEELEGFDMVFDNDAIKIYKLRE